MPWVKHWLVVQLSGHCTNASKIERRKPSHVKITKLLLLNSEGDFDFYLDSLDAVLIMIKKDPGEDEVVGAFYDRASLDSTEKSFTCVYDAAKCAVQRQRAELVRDAMTDASKAAPVKGKDMEERKGGDAENEKALLKALCIRFQKIGGCKRGSE